MSSPRGNEPERKHADDLEDPLGRHPGDDEEYKPENRPEQESKSEDESRETPPASSEPNPNLTSHNLEQCFEHLNTTLHISYLPSRLPSLGDLVLTHFFHKLPDIRTLSALKETDAAVFEAVAEEVTDSFLETYADRLWNGRDRRRDTERALRAEMKGFVTGVLRGEGSAWDKRREGEVLVQDLIVGGGSAGGNGSEGWGGWRNGWEEMPALEPANQGLGVRMEYQGKKDEGMEEWKGDDSDEEPDRSESDESEKVEGLKATQSDSCLVKLRERAEVLDRQELVNGRSRGGEAGSTPGDVVDEGLQEELQRVYLDLLQRDLAELNLKAPEQGPVEDDADGEKNSIDPNDPRVKYGDAPPSNRKPS